MKRLAPILALILIAARLGSAAPPRDPESAIRQALDELRAVEAQIRNKLQAQTARGDKIKPLEMSDKVAEDFLSGNDESRKEGRKVLETIQGSLDRDLQAMSAAEASARARLARSRQGIELAAPAMLHEARSGATDERGALGLALLQEGHRRSAHEAIERALSLEDLRGSREGNREKIGQQIGLYNALADLPLRQLRDRHREISRRLSKLYAETSKSGSGAGRGQGEKLDAMIADLGKAPKEDFAAWKRKWSEGDSPASSSAPAPSRPAPGQPVAAEGDAPLEVPYEDQTELPLGARQGDGAPTLEMEIKPVDRAPSGEEFRQTFWRAESTQPRALAPGTVLFSGAFSGFRHLLILDHGDGWTMVYGNLTSCDLMEGDAVAAGRAVGQYQAEETGDPQPLWIEARKDTRPVAVESFPPAGKDWMPRLFGEGGL